MKNCLLSILGWNDWVFHMYVCPHHNSKLESISVTEVDGHSDYDCNASHELPHSFCLPNFTHKTLELELKIVAKDTYTGVPHPRCSAMSPNLLVSTAFSCTTITNFQLGYFWSPLWAARCHSFIVGLWIFQPTLVLSKMLRCLTGDFVIINQYMSVYKHF